jgi:hypothetical protein
MTEDSDSPGQHRDNRLAWVLAAVVIAIVAGCSVLMTTNGSKPDPAFDAGRVCREFVKERLKAPASADFGSPTVLPAAGGWQVTNTVDAENSFGAKIRTDFVCVVHQDGADWVLDRMVGLDG